MNRESNSDRKRVGFLGFVSGATHRYVKAERKNNKGESWGGGLGCYGGIVDIGVELCKLVGGGCHLFQGLWNRIFLWKRREQTRKN